MVKVPSVSFSCFDSIEVLVHTAYLTYELNGDTIDFQHTYVPSNYRGKGLAEKLVLVKPSSFSQMYISSFSFRVH